MAGAHRIGSIVDQDFLRVIVMRDGHLASVVVVEVLPGVGVGFEAVD